MRSRLIIEKIKSSYILKYIINYISDKKTQFKSFKYSKLFQKEYNIYI